jgi:hypothetical protein
LAVALPVGNAAAQQKQHVSFKVPAENSKVTQQQNIEVGDVANHIVRVYEVRRTFPSNAPVIEGLKLVDESDRGIADLIDGNGLSNQYTVFTMENGDKLFARGSNVVQVVSGKLSATGVASITGGTGKFATTQGVVRINANFDLKSGFNENQIEIDYVLSK